MSNILPPHMDTSTATQQFAGELTTDPDLARLSQATFTALMEGQILTSGEQDEVGADLCKMTRVR
ncbi:hypothetical protein V3G39_09210 [Dermatophilaceae bacterium Sec6.4]